jgi:hypothetical protein
LHPEHFGNLRLRFAFIDQWPAHELAVWAKLPKTCVSIRPTAFAVSTCSVKLRKQLGPTRLSFLEYLLIGIASSMLSRASEPRRL